MSNINIICKSDKCEFTNYFSEPIVVPKHAEICLNKASFTVPILCQQLLTIPSIPVANRTDNWIDVIIDGVLKKFTWRNFYDAWALFVDGEEQSLGVTENQFYDGTFQMFLNNPVKQVVPGAAPSVLYKTTFQETFANMVDVEMEFYSVYPRAHWERNETDILVNAIDVLDDGNNWIITPVQGTTWGLNSTYYPAGIANKTPTDMTFAAGEVSNWTRTGTFDILTSAGAGTLGTYDCIAYKTDQAIDCNGGYYRFEKDNSGVNSCTVGVKCSFGTASGITIPASITARGIIDVGFEFTDTTVRAFDRGKLEMPEAAIDTYLDTDLFYIMCIRDGPIGPNSNKYRIQLLHGSVGETPSQSFIVYESLIVGPANGEITCSFVAIADGANHKLKEIKAVEMTADSLAQNELLNPSNSLGMPFQGNIILRGGFDFNDLVSTQTDIERFYNILGINKFLSGGPGDFYLFPDVDQPNNADMSMSWERKIQVLAKDCRYIISPTGAENEYDRLANNCITISQANSLLNLPRMLEVRINNISLKNFSGTYVGASNPTGILNEEGINKIVGTIPTPKPNNVIVNTDWIINYEPYNPVFRPLNNSAPFPINEIVVEVSYKDFNTGQRKTIDIIDGTLALEFHIKPGDPPERLNNNLRPI